MSDPMSAIVFVVVSYTSFVIALAMLGMAKGWWDRRRRRPRPYDGGCIHRPHTCKFCLQHQRTRRLVK